MADWRNMLSSPRPQSKCLVVSNSYQCHKARRGTSDKGKQWNVSQDLKQAKHGWKSNQAEKSVPWLWQKRRHPLQMFPLELQNNPENQHGWENLHSIAGWLGSELKARGTASPGEGSQNNGFVCYVCLQEKHSSLLRWFNRTVSKRRAALGHQERLEA